MIIRASSVEAEKMSLLRVLHLGFSGSGKTSSMSKADNVLILEPSPQAVTSIRASNPEALIFPVGDLKDLSEAYKMLKDAKLIDKDGYPALEIKHGGETFEVTTVCLDDFEEIQDMLKKDIQGDSDAMTQQMWGALNDRCMGWLRAFRNLPVNFHSAAKLTRLSDEDIQVHELSIYGAKLKPAMLGLFNCVGYHYRKTATTEDSREYVVGFQLPDKFISKGHPALDAVEDSDPNVWLEKIRNWAGSLDDAPRKARRAQLPPEARKGNQQPTQQSQPTQRRKSAPKRR